VAGAFDDFRDLRGQSDSKIARLLREMEIDIAIDLGGLTQDCRPEILAQRPAPLQVNYLGYAGTMGGDFIDYVIGDGVALPFDLQPFFTETIVHLPGSFMVNSEKGAARTGLTRAALGLPQQGFVFCNFGNSSKIGQTVFEIWLRILAAVAGSLLWLKEGDESIRARLRGHATARGLDASRIVFTGRAERDMYLAQFGLADLFLDTFPFNAHATASDALAMGLPVLTAKGGSFASRVASSLVHLGGIAELAADGLAAYERQAIRFAEDAALRRRIRAQLQGSRDALMNGAETCRSLETAYQRMRQVLETNQLPHNFRV
jgi:predicted O-linked N-acetylglucosamine transferase (SPINDLY family)